MQTLNSLPRNHTERTSLLLQTVEGYLFLGLYRLALKEIDKIEVYDQEDREVMLARARTLLYLGSWRKALRVSARGQALHIEEVEFTVQRAFALTKLKKIEASARVILEAPVEVRRTGIIHYNLACYAARWRDLAGAKLCLEAAIMTNASLKKKAIKDPDLAELWN